MKGLHSTPQILPTSTWPLVWLPQALVDEFQQASNSTRNIQTIEDMQNFVEGFSEFTAAQRNAGKHVTLMSELSSAVESRGLMQISSVSRSECIRGYCWLACLL
jgi:Sec1 family